MKRFWLLIFFSLLLAGCSLPAAAVVPTPTGNIATSPTAEGGVSPTPPSPTVTPTLAPDARVCTGFKNGNLNVRSCPGTECSVLATLAEGTPVMIYRTGNDREGRMGWVKVVVKDDEGQPLAVGWVYSPYLCPREEKK